MNLDTSSLLLPQNFNLELDGKRPGSSMDFSSQLLPDSSARRFASQEPARLEDHTLLDLDLGEDDAPFGHDFSIELGRDAPAPRPVEEDLFSEEGKIHDIDLGLDLGEDDAPLEGMDFGDNSHDNIDRFLQPDEPMDFGGDDDSAAAGPSAARGEAMGSARQSLDRFGSPGAAGDGEAVNGDLAAQDSHRAKRRKVKAIGYDEVTYMDMTAMTGQQEDRSAILKPVSYLPRDAVLLTLMNMQKNGDFVSSIMSDGRGRGWAPELRGMLSLDNVRRATELKRKRDSGVSDMDIDAAKVPALDLGEDEGPLPVDEGIGLESTLNQRSQIEFPADDGDRAGSDDEGMGPGADDFDDTVVHPADSGPVSLGTKHAVHLLRERFGGVAAADTASPQKKSVSFQSLCPEKETTKADATKMFFETLVLATKDAIKVEQGNTVIGGPLRIKAKRALWGSWAETEAGGEIATQPAPIEA